MVGKKLDGFGMQSPRRDNRDNFNNEIARELDYDFIALQHQVAELVPLLLPEQNHVFHQVLRKIDSGNGGLFFLDAPGGTGKTFLLNLLLMSARKDKK
ncbi:ATP-dependent DNA helicase [Trichonephila clavipes]|nr:ATP-dependent DNA helicase [Trichonephila clavipes]